MFVHRKPGWALSESAATPESVYVNRREILRSIGLGGLAAAGMWVGGGLLTGGKLAHAAEEDPTASLYPVDRNTKYTLDRPITSEELATSYNNFYEFGSHKSISRAAQKLPLRPWTVTFDGLVEQEQTIDFDALIRKMPLEERVYRMRCVEAWSMAVPWSGFAMAAMVDFARPLSSAKYISMQTFQNPKVAPGQRESWYPWPYTEGLTIEEARNELAFIATGLYGKPIPKQNGAPLRLAVPWKYGFKNIKSIVRFTFTDERPVSFWEDIQAREYGFWANVNPAVSHPRWSQATERVLGTDERVPTLIYNGYEEFVGELYAGLEDERLFM